MKNRRKVEIYYTRDDQYDKEIELDEITCNADNVDQVIDDRTKRYNKKGWQLLRVRSSQVDE